MATKIGALWRHEYEDRETGKKKVFYAGEMEYPGVKCRLILRQNENTQNEKAPALLLFYESFDPRPDSTQKGAEAQEAQEDGDISF
jgi:hypothetical protein